MNNNNNLIDILYKQFTSSFKKLQNVTDNLNLSDLETKESIDLFNEAINSTSGAKPDEILIKNGKHFIKVAE